MKISIDSNSLIRNYYFYAYRTDRLATDQFLEQNRIYAYDDGIIVTEKDYSEILKQVADSDYSKSVAKN